jgi:hypothetical protein
MLGGPSFTVKQLPRSAAGFSPYWYEIWRGPNLVAKYWHDYRGDESCVVFPDGSEEPWLAGSCATFLTGGGPKPTGLSKEAVELLTEWLWAKKGCNACRSGWERGPQPFEVGACKARRASLHLCRQCGTYWERQGDDVDVILVGEARRHYSIPYE